MPQPQLQKIDNDDISNETLFIVSFFPGFAQLNNIVQTVALLKGYNYVAVLNNINMTKKNKMFATGNEKYKMPNMEKKHQSRFYRIPQTTLFEFTAARGKETIADTATLYTICPV